MAVVKYITANANVMKNRFGQSTWNNARGTNLTTSQGSNDGTTSGYEYLQVKSTKTGSRGGGSSYHNNRAFLQFDLRGVVPNSSVVESGVIRLWRTDGSGDGIRVVKATIDDADLTTNNNDYGKVIESGMSTAIDESWSNESTHGLSSENGYEEISLNSDGVQELQDCLLTPIASSSDIVGYFKVGIITELDHDNSTPTGTTKDMRFSSISAIEAQRPQLKITFKPPVLRGNF